MLQGDEEQRVKDGENSNGGDDAINQSMSFEDQGSSDAIYQDQCNHLLVYTPCIILHHRMNLNLKISFFPTADMSMMSSMQFDEQVDGSSGDLMFMEAGPSSGTAADNSGTGM